jgi:hypothetical protein
MSELGWPSIVVYVLSSGAIALWAIASRGKMRESLEVHRDLLKKIALGVIVASAGFWYTTVPYAGQFYDFDDNLEFPQNLDSDADKAKYLRDHHHRIEDLERELKQQREESRQLREHYAVVLYLGFYAILFYGVLSIFGNRKDLPPDDIVRLNLDKE